MNMISIRVFGFVGLAGAILMFIGDIWLHGHLGSGRDFMANLSLIVSKQPDTQIVAGGFIGPIASLLYCLGFFSIYGMISPESPVLAAIATGSAAASIVIGGAYHAMWGIRGLLIKAGLPSSNYQGLYNKIVKYTRLFYNTMLVLAGVAALVLLFVVLSGRSLYPRWTAVVNPGLLLLFKPLTRFIPSPLGAIISGGYLNLVFVVFFSVILIVT
jgi:hypothetical protein